MSAINNTTISVTEEFICPTVPDYEESVVQLFFSNENDFKKWFKSTAFSHSKWVHKRTNTSKENASLMGKPLVAPLVVSTSYYLCYHPGHPRIKTGRNIKCINNDTKNYFINQ